MGGTLPQAAVGDTSARCAACWTCYTCSHARLGTNTRFARIPAGILPSDPAQLAKARLWADLWGSYIGPAQVRVGGWVGGAGWLGERRASVVPSCRAGEWAFWVVELGTAVDRCLKLQVANTCVTPLAWPTSPRPLLAVQTAILQADTKAKVAEAVEKMVAALKAS